ncbi:LAME_0H19812g1_1 [Lachancea meyersii CBS 8951]|uniref:LAME_0H19812g1_1 n=1 Tax=Lachancea meyersii CBS 8951 TaxID=1266667 RepID=A0A1G4KJF4_9SACH|nr:LAME_0H19812g1_1 [Lachancea meyersii CBS 8951]
MTSYMYYPSYAAPAPAPVAPQRQPHHNHSQSMGASGLGNYGYYQMPQPLQGYYQSRPQQLYTHQHSASYQMVLPPPGMGYMAPAVAPPALMLPQLPQPYQAVMPQAQPQPQQQPHQDQVNGGVREVLDYDLDMMSDFVVKNAYLVFDNDDVLNAESSSVSNIFKKGVSSVLNATRLPSVTVFMALDFLCKYISKFPNGIEALGGDSVNVIYQNLMIAFVLANKFNDDKTFTNKSWSHATGMDLTTVNKFEREWLATFEWKLFDDNFILFDEYTLSFQQFCEEKRAPAAFNPYSIPPLSSSVSQSAGYSPSYQGCSGFQTPVQAPPTVYSSPSHTDERSGTSSYFYQPSFASPISGESPLSKNVYNGGNGYNYYSAPLQAPSLAPVWGGQPEDFFTQSQFVQPSKSLFCYSH